MSDSLYLILKCTLAALVMVAIHFLSKSPSYYLSAIALSFPAMSIIAYYFMYLERGAADVAVTTRFAVLVASPPFIAFLLTLYLTIKTFNPYLSFFFGFLAWLVLTLLLVFAWNRFH